MVETKPARYALRTIVIVYLVMLIGWPVSLVARNTFADGFDALAGALTDPAMIAALRLTVVVAVWAVALNTVFGVGVSLLLTRTTFRGQRFLSLLLDLPLSVSPVVVGLALILTYGRDGWFGPALATTGWEVIFAPPGIVLATTFISLPLVIREIVPVLNEIGNDEEQAARSLGAGPVQTFRRITLPAIKWALIYGVILTLARSLGEFGAVKIVSGNIAGYTQTATLLVEEKYQDFEAATAYATSFLLAMVSIACIIVVSFLRPDPARKESA